MIKFKYFETTLKVRYPTGDHFSTNIYDYCRGIVDILRDLYPREDIILVGRGHSGSIIAGAIGYGLLACNPRRYINIYNVRKTREDSHANLYSSNIFKTIDDDTRIVIVDDFIDTGRTLKEIIKDLKSHLNSRTFDVLCVGNYLDEKNFNGEEEYPCLKNFSKCFEYVICNKPSK